LPHRGCPPVDLLGEACCWTWRSTIDATLRRRHHERLEFITPVIKAFLTDQGFQCASRALQVFGGHGYVVETGIEQFMRDARIT
jgi:alkylation response protein AidB-like acyl-CoA dehydrogenase